MGFDCIFLYSDYIYNLKRIMILEGRRLNGEN